MPNFLNDVVNYACMNLNQHDHCIDYLMGRGVNLEVAERFSLGYIPSGFVADELSDSSHGDHCFDKEKKPLWCDSCRFNKWSGGFDESGSWVPGLKLSDVITFPITTYSGSLYGFQTRSLKEKTYDTFMIRRRPEAAFFGLSSQIHSIWNSRKLVLAEGPFDMMILSRFVGMPILSLNTSSVNSSQATFIRRFVSELFLCLDKDEAGRSGSRTAVERLSAELTVRDVKWWASSTKSKDPNDFWRESGDVKFRAQISSVFRNLT